MRTRARVTARTACAGGMLAVALLLPGCGTVPTVSSVNPAPSGTATGPVAPVTQPATTTPDDTSPTTTTTTSTTTAKKKTSTGVLASGSKGTKVRELQVRLRQLGWYSGSISGTYASSTVKGVRGFQGKHDLKKTGRVDAKTWSALTRLTKQPTKDEMTNVLRPGKAIYSQGSSGDKIRELQARLKQIGWFSGAVTPTYGSATAAAVRGFQDKRDIPITGEVDSRTWNRLTSMTRTPTDDALHNRVPKPSAAGLDKRCLTGGDVICISKTSRSLTWVLGGKPALRMDVRFGAVGTPTREGTFSVQRKEVDWTSTIYHSKMPYSLFFSGGQAVHYSSDFAARGYAGASHGCVNVRNLAALKAMFAAASVGDKVVVYR